MKFLVVLTVVVAVASAQLNRYNSAAQATVRASSSDQSANIVQYENNANPDGSYSYSVQSDNGISAAATGSLRDFGGNPSVVGLVSQGSYSWTSPEGVPVSITYVADENGYQAQGAAIPTSPPIPAEIARALEYLAKYGTKE